MKKEKITFEDWKKIEEYLDKNKDNFKSYFYYIDIKAKMYHLLSYECKENVMEIDFAFKTNKEKFFKEIDLSNKNIEKKIFQTIPYYGMSEIDIMQKVIKDVFDVDLIDKYVKSKEYLKIEVNENIKGKKNEYDEGIKKMLYCIDRNNKEMFKENPEIILDLICLIKDTKTRFIEMGLSYLIKIQKQSPKFFNENLEKIEDYLSCIEKTNKILTKKYLNIIEKDKEKIMGWEIKKEKSPILYGILNKAEYIEINEGNVEEKDGRLKLFKNTSKYRTYAKIDNESNNKNDNYLSTIKLNIVEYGNKGNLNLSNLKRFLRNLGEYVKNEDNNLRGFSFIEKNKEVNILIYGDKEKVKSKRLAIHSIIEKYMTDEIRMTDRGDLINNYIDDFLKKHELKYKISHILKEKEEKTQKTPKI